LSLSSSLPLCRAVVVIVVVVVVVAVVVVAVVVVAVAVVVVAVVVVVVVVVIVVVVVVVVVVVAVIVVVVARWRLSCRRGRLHHRRYHKLRLKSDRNWKNHTFTLESLIERPKIDKELM